MLIISIHRQSPTFVGYDTITLDESQAEKYLKARGAAKIHIIRKWLQERRNASDGCIICKTNKC